MGKFWNGFTQEKSALWVNFAFLSSRDETVETRKLTELKILIVVEETLNVSHCQKSQLWSLTHKHCS